MAAKIPIRPILITHSSPSPSVSSRSSLLGTTLCFDALRVAVLGLPLTAAF